MVTGYDDPGCMCAGEVYLALERRYVTVADRGDVYVARRYNNRRRRHAPRSGVRRPLLYFRVNDMVIERGL